MHPLLSLFNLEVGASAARAGAGAGIVVGVEPFKTGNAVGVVATLGTTNIAPRYSERNYSIRHGYAEFTERPQQLQRHPILQSVYSVHARMKVRCSNYCSRLIRTKEMDDPAILPHHVVDLGVVLHMVNDTPPTLYGNANFSHPIAAPGFNGVIHPSLAPFVRKARPLPRIDHGPHKRLNEGVKLPRLTHSPLQELRITRVHLLVNNRRPRYRHDLDTNLITFAGAWVGGRDPRGPFEAATQVQVTVGCRV